MPENLDFWAPLVTPLYFCSFMLRALVSLMWKHYAESFHPFQQAGKAQEIRATVMAGATENLRLPSFKRVCPLVTCICPPGSVTPSAILSLPRRVPTHSPLRKFFRIRWVVIADCYLPTALKGL